MPREQAMKVPHLFRLAGALPPEVKELRIVKIGEVDEQADGGTHIADAKEIGRIELLDVQNKGKNNRRLYFKVV
jgi:misacylated tRNA(Ala) deacylase